MVSEKRIGLDVGGVIIPKSAEEGTAEEYLQSAPVPGAVSGVKALIEAYGQNSVFIISRCPDFAESMVLEWLERSELLTADDLKRSNIHFCRRKSDKAPIARKLELTHFVDDRLEVLRCMEDVVACRIQFTDSDEGRQNTSEDGIELVGGWVCLEQFLLLKS